MKQVISIVLIALCFMLYASFAHAQQVALSISPPLLEVTIKPGKSILVAYTLRNNGDPAIMKATILPFEPKGNQGQIQLKSEFEGPIQFSLENSNLQLDQPFFLKTRESQQLLLRIHIPEGAPEGDYYYTLLNETEPSPATEGITSSRAKATIGSNILITVTPTGQVDLKGKITLFETLPHYVFSLLGKKFSFFDSSDPVPIILQVQNSGKNMIKPQGVVTLKGGFGQTAQYQILPENILSQSQRLLHASPSATFEAKPTSLVLHGFFIGTYQLSTSVTFGEGSPNLYASTSFLALPIKLLLVLIVAIGLSIFAILRFDRRSEDE